CTLVFSRVIHFMNLILFRGSVVLVRDCRRYSLRRASNLYAPRSRTHRGWSRWFCCGGHRSIVDLDLSRSPLARRTLEPKIQRVWIQLFSAYWSLRRGWYDCVFSSVSTRRSALCCARH